MKPWAYCKIIDDLFLGYNAENLDNTVKLCFFKFVVMYIAYCFIIQLVLNNFNTQVKFTCSFILNYSHKKSELSLLHNTMNMMNHVLNENQM